MPHCLITGGAGFIGSHLAKHLLDSGAKVTIIDDLSTGSMRNIVELKTNSNFEYVIDDCQNRNIMGELIDQADEIYHLAAAVGVKLIVADAAKTIDLNYSLTKIVLDMALKKKKPLLFTSTSEVYGKSTELPYKEEGDLLLGSSKKWRWAYACSKLLDEFMLLSAFRNHDLPAVIVRLFNTVGPKQTGRYGMVIPTFVNQAITNSSITVYGTGKQSRCFCHVNDIVPVFPKLLRNDRAYGNIFNVGNDFEISIIDLANKIKAQLDSESLIEFISYEKAYNKGFEDMNRRIPCLSKIAELLQFKTTYSLDDIIKDVYEDIKKMQSE